MLKYTTKLFFLLFFVVGVINSQDVNVKAPIVSLTGAEKFEFTVPQNQVFRSYNIPAHVTATNTFEFLATNVFTRYDLQSNGVSLQIWRDPNTPDNVHAAFTTATQANFSDRTSTYIFSDDGGENWAEMGAVPPIPPTSGFVAITGLSTGIPVLANHNNLNSLGTRTVLFKDASVGAGNFTAFDPGLVIADPATGAIWPRVAGSGENVAVVASVNGGVGHWTNSLNAAGTFAGWAQNVDGDQAETYSIAAGENGTVGMVWISDGETTTRNVYYSESADNGVTWGDAVLLWDWDEAGDSIGGLRGVSLTFVGNTPHAVFEVTKVGVTSYFPSWPSKIMYWNGNMEDAKVLADSNNIPYAPNAVGPAVHLPLCRPSISATSDGRGIFVTINASTNVVSTTEHAYFAGYFTYSLDGGETWTTPVRVTPESPRMDWRFFSQSPKTHFVDNTAYVIFTAQARDTAGIAVQEGPPAADGTTQFYVISTEVALNPSSVEDNYLVNSFELGQNYPNPFNPSTSINYTIANSGLVTLKVYDVLGKEVATLVNETKNAGSHKVNFDASNLSSGLYIYTIQSGEFVSSKKMMLLK